MKSTAKTDNRKVLIRGHVYSYSEKAPFVPSGKSVLGALEYDEAAEKVRCHECGEWFGRVSNKHLQNKHHMSAATYKANHGLNATTGICSLAFSNKCKKAGRKSVQGVEREEKLERLFAANREHRALHGNNGKNRGKQAERLNEIGRCRAQTVFKIQTLAKTTGRTPTRDELKTVDIYPSLLKRTFGSYAAAIKESGLEPRAPGLRTNVRQPPERPTEPTPEKHRLDEPLPWPDWYFETNYLERAPSMAERANLQFKNHTP